MTQRTVTDANASLKMQSGMCINVDSNSSNGESGDIN